MVIIDNYVLIEDIERILEVIKSNLTNGKLASIKKSTSGIKVNCPIHAGGKENKPSCYIRESDGIFHCFSCGEKGPFYKFVAEAMDCSIEYAKKWLCANFGKKTSDTTYVGETIELKEAQSKYKQYCNPEILDGFQNWTPYFKTRGITRETVASFGVKYDSKNRVVVFPCYDIKGNLVMLHTRSIDKKLFHLDENVPKPLFGIYEIIKNNNKKAIVTEGPFDALKASQFGFPACATLGNLSDSQIEQINESCIEYLYIMFDNDDAGRAFTADLKAKLRPSIIVSEPKIPDGKKDIGELDYDEFWSAINNCNSELISFKKNKIIVV